ncbi:hypothetical protein [Streptococcus halichoeri]|uniref:hypothetical protein n=1 Tax=Streptococcus halichoeri TaxID=254785 RepID=UPI0013586BCD|nr:hypothetical protein [Streptococcus halichoeri]
MKTLKKTVIVAVATLALAGLSGMTHGSNVFANSTGEGNLNVHSIEKTNKLRQEIKALKEQVEQKFKQYTPDYADETMQEIAKAFLSSDYRNEMGINWDSKGDLDAPGTNLSLEDTLTEVAGLEALTTHYQNILDIMSSVNQ